MKSHIFLGAALGGTIALVLNIIFGALEWN